MSQFDLWRHDLSIPRNYHMFDVIMTWNDMKRHDQLSWCYDVMMSWEYDVIILYTRLIIVQPVTVDAKVMLPRTIEFSNKDETTSGEWNLRDLRFKDPPRKTLSWGLIAPKDPNFKNEIEVNFPRNFRQKYLESNVLIEQIFPFYFELSNFWNFTEISQGFPALLARVANNADVKIGTQRDRDYAIALIPTDDLMKGYKDKLEKLPSNMDFVVIMLPTKDAGLYNHVSLNLRLWDRWWRHHR